MPLSSEFTFHHIHFVFSPYLILMLSSAITEFDAGFFYLKKKRNVRFQVFLFQENYKYTPSYQGGFNLLPLFLGSAMMPSINRNLANLFPHHLDVNIFCNFIGKLKSNNMTQGKSSHKKGLKGLKRHIKGLSFSPGI